jgi:hypothetical protein
MQAVNESGAHSRAENRQLTGLFRSKKGHPDSAPRMGGIGHAGRQADCLDPRILICRHRALHQTSGRPPSGSAAGIPSDRLLISRDCICIGIGSTEHLISE